jgi:8-oxo-dGTP pyrophosphatase MutT (NUDIX family)
MTIPTIPAAPTPDPAPKPSTSPRPGARVVLLDSDHRVLLLHAADPTVPGRRWWELPGGGLQPGETTIAACRRELSEETGIVLDEIGPCIWVRESRFTYKGHRHHRKDWIHLARLPTGIRRAPTSHSSNERTGLLGERWWSLDELADRGHEQVIPPSLPTLLPPILAGRYPPSPIELPD